MRFRIRGQHGDSRTRRIKPARQSPMHGSPLFQAPVPSGPPLPQRERPAPPWDQRQPAPRQPAQGYRRLPSVTDLAEQVTQAMPAVRRVPRTAAEYPEFRLARIPAEAAVAAMPKLTYPRPGAPLAAYDGVMQVVSALTGTQTEPDVWARPMLAPAVTGDEEIRAWGKYRDADLRRRLAAAQRRAFAGSPS